jgi:anthranilate/para-aminobenzoate synthase component II
VITIIDFDDSFTYNLYSELSSYAETKVIHFKKLGEEILSRDYSKKEIYVLGPGPGHPDEYELILNDLKLLLQDENSFIFGVCLGHQLVWKTFGLPVSPACKLIHGQTERLVFDRFFNSSTEALDVQRYNSLSVKLSADLCSRFDLQGWSFVKKGEELYASRYKNILTYQFHPESIGSQNKALLYSPLKQFLLN